MIVESRNGTIVQRCGMICTVSSSVSGFGYTYWWLNCSVFVQITPIKNTPTNQHIASCLIISSFRQKLTLFWTNNRSVIIFLQIFCFRLKIKKTHQKLVPMCLWFFLIIPLYLFNFYRLLVQLIFRQELLPLEIIVQHLLLLHQ